MTFVDLRHFDVSLRGFAFSFAAKVDSLDLDNLVLSHKKRNVQSYTLENTANILPNLPRTPRVL